MTKQGMRKWDNSGRVVVGRRRARVDQKSFVVLKLSCGHEATANPGIPPPKDGEDFFCPECQHTGRTEE